MSPIMMEVIEWFDQTGTGIVQALPGGRSGDIKMVPSSSCARPGRGLLPRRPGARRARTRPPHPVHPEPADPHPAALAALGVQSRSARGLLRQPEVFTNMRWARDPVAFKDSQLGLIRLRAFGSFTMRVAQPLLFVNSLVGTQGSYTTDQIEDYLREVIVARLNDFLGETVQSLLELPRQYDEMAVAVKTRLAEEFRKYGTEMVDFYINRITPPEDVERMIDERSSMGAVGDLDRFLKFKAAKAMGDAAQGHGRGGRRRRRRRGRGRRRGARHDDAGHARKSSAPIWRVLRWRAVTCPGCQAAVAADSRFCPRCGRQIATTTRCARAARPRCGRRALLLGLRPGGARRLAPARAPRALSDDVSMSQVVVSTECPTCSGPLDFLRGRQCHPLSELRLRPARHRPQAGPELLGRAKGQGGGRGSRGAHGPAPGARGGRPALLRALLPDDGHDFQWQDVPPKPEPESPAFPTSARAWGGGRESDRPEIDIPLGSVLSWGADVLLGRKAGDVVRDLLGRRGSRSARSTWPCSPPCAHPDRAAPDGQGSSSTLRGEDLPGRGPGGPRRAPRSVCAPGAPRVPVRARRPAALGTIVAVQLAPDRAMAQGLAAAASST